MFENRNPADDRERVGLFQRSTSEDVDEAGLPRGVFNVVTGSGASVGAPLIEHPDVRLVSFTGSTAVGRAVSRACAEVFRPCSLEMGGTKSTGNGHREAGTAALDTFTEWKSVYVDFSGRLQKAQIDGAEVV